MGRAVIMHIDDAPWVRAGPPGEEADHRPQRDGHQHEDQRRGPRGEDHPGGIVEPAGARADPHGRIDPRRREAHGEEGRAGNRLWEI